MCACIAQGPCAVHGKGLFTLNCKKLEKVREKMSLGYVYLILMAGITLAFAIGIVKWMNAPADRYDTLLEELAKRKEEEHN